VGYPKTPFEPWKTLKLKPRGLCAKLVHFWTKVQKPSQLGSLSHLGYSYVNLPVKPYVLGLFAKITSLAQ
jgi:hypothetical protein